MYSRSDGTLPFRPRNPFTLSVRECLLAKHTVNHTRAMHDISSRPMFSMFLRPSDVASSTDTSQPCFKLRDYSISFLTDVLPRRLFFYVILLQIPNIFLPRLIILFDDPALSLVEMKHLVVEQLSREMAKENPGDATDGLQFMLHQKWMSFDRFNYNLRIKTFAACFLLPFCFMNLWRTALAGEDWSVFPYLACLYHCLLTFLLVFMGRPPNLEYSSGKYMLATYRTLKTAMELQREVHRPGLWNMYTELSLPLALIAWLMIIFIVIVSAYGEHFDSMPDKSRVEMEFQMGISFSFLAFTFFFVCSVHALSKQDDAARECYEQVGDATAEHSYRILLFEHFDIQSTGDTLDGVGKTFLSRVIKLSRLPLA